MNVRAYLWQRGTAALLLPLILIHLAVIFYATRQGLTAADMLNRTRGSVAWAAFYGTFVLAASIHAVIGIRNVLAEWTSLSPKSAASLSGLLGLLLLVLGARAIYAMALA